MAQVTKYCVVLDAGSSGTRAYVYEWKEVVTEISQSTKDATVAADNAKLEAENAAAAAATATKAAADAAVKAKEASGAKKAAKAKAADEAEDAATPMQRKAVIFAEAAEDAAAVLKAAKKADVKAAARAKAAAGVVPKVRLATGWKSLKTKQGLHTLAPKLQENINADHPVHLSEQIEIYQTTTAITAATTEKVTTELEPLFVGAKKFLQSKGVDTAPLFLIATAGMRRLKQQKYDSFSILKKAIIKYINRSGFEKPRFDAILGDDEGLYGWIAANSVDNLFGENIFPHGFMEMGGESAQIAVSLTPDQYSKYKGALRGVTLGGRKYVVFAKTWPGLGLDSAWRRHEAKLRECGSTLAYDPCLPNQFAYRLSGSDKIVVGTGNFPECLKETITLLGCPHPECANGQLCINRSPDSSGDRVGCLLRDPLTGNTVLRFDKDQFSGASVYARAMYGVFEELDPKEAAGNGDPFGVFWDQVNALARRNWEQLKADRPREDHLYLHKAFFMAGMIMSTLFFGFGIAMPSKVAAVGDDLASERARRALREALAEERQVKEDNDAVKEELDIQRNQHVRDRTNAKKDRTKATTAKLDANKVAVPTYTEEAAFGHSAQGAHLVQMLGSRQAIVTQRMIDNARKLNDANIVLKDVRKRLKNSVEEIRAIDTKAAGLQDRGLTEREKVDDARKMPGTLESPDARQQDLYKSIRDTNWTLGYAVLHANGTEVVDLSKHTWSTRTEQRFVPHNKNRRD